METPYFWKVIGGNVDGERVLKREKEGKGGGIPRKYIDCAGGATYISIGIPHPTAYAKL